MRARHQLAHLGVWVELIGFSELGGRFFKVVKCGGEELTSTGHDSFVVGILKRLGVGYLKLGTVLSGVWKLEMREQWLLRLLEMVHDCSFC